MTKHIEECLQGYAAPYNPRVLVIIDGVDELGSSRAMDIIRQIAAYVDANSEATLVATTRLLPGMSVTGQIVKLSPMEDEESLSLMQKVLGRPNRCARHVPMATVNSGGASHSFIRSYDRCFATAQP